jgi:hypothetical protein
MILLMKMKLFRANFLHHPITSLPEVGIYWPACSQTFQLVSQPYETAVKHYLAYFKIYELMLNPID